MTRVKICGITNWADAELAADLGASALGFNFVPASPRCVTPAQAWSVIRRLPPFIQPVGVFVNWQPEAIAVLARAVGLRAAQLHGEESPRQVAELVRHLTVIKAFRMHPGFRLPKLRTFRDASALLLDGFSPDARGGTGKTFDWTLARRARRYGQIILSGGLRPENVGEAICVAEPYAIDVASGVEKRPGVKDPARLRALFREVEAAEDRKKLARSPR